jgi:hypothetical protein
MVSFSQACLGFKVLMKTYPEEELVDSSKKSKDVFSVLLVLVRAVTHL